MSESFMKKLSENGYQDTWLFYTGLHGDYPDCYFVGWNGDENQLSLVGDYKIKISAVLQVVYRKLYYKPIIIS